MYPEALILRGFLERIHDFLQGGRRFYNFDLLEMSADVNHRAVVSFDPAMNTNDCALPDFWIRCGPVPFTFHPVIGPGFLRKFQGKVRFPVLAEIKIISAGS